MGINPIMEIVWKPTYDGGTGTQNSMVKICIFPCQNGCIFGHAFFKAASAIFIGEKVGVQHCSTLFNQSLKSSKLPNHVLVTFRVVMDRLVDYEFP